MRIFEAATRLLDKSCTKRHSA